MTEITSLSDLPQTSAVYAMHGGQKRGLYVAYVGIASKLKNRIIQHLIRRDSSVATGTSAVALLPDYITEVYWWEHAGFDQRSILEAAELVAFDVLEPALRSRKAVQGQVKQLYDDKEFYQKMQLLFSGEPAGRFVITTLQTAIDRIVELEQRVKALEQYLTENNQIHP